MRPEMPYVSTVTRRLDGWDVRRIAQEPVADSTAGRVHGGPAVGGASSVCDAQFRCAQIRLCTRSARLPKEPRARRAVDAAEEGAEVRDVLFGQAGGWGRT